jgi:hypothetical protein
MDPAQILYTTRKHFTNVGNMLHIMVVTRNHVNQSHWWIFGANQVENSLFFNHVSDFDGVDVVQRCNISGRNVNMKYAKLRGQRTGFL